MKHVTLACLILLGHGGGQVGAGPLYTNGPKYPSGRLGGDNPFSYWNQFVAHDFTLRGDSTLGGLTFTTSTRPSTAPITGVHVNVYAAGGSPVGAELWGGTFAIESEVVRETLAGYTVKDVSVALPGWDLAAGTYWLGLRVDPGEWDLLWTIASYSPIGHPTVIGDAAGEPGSYAPYNPNFSYENSFALHGEVTRGPAVPEPASLTLLGVGGALGLLVCRLRSRKPPAASAPDAEQDRAR